MGFKRMAHMRVSCRFWFLQSARIGVFWEPMYYALVFLDDFHPVWVEWVISGYSTSQKIFAFLAAGA